MTESPRRDEPGAGPETPSAPGRLERLARATDARLRVLRDTTQRWAARAPRVVAVMRMLFYPLALALVGYMGYRAARDTHLSDLHYWPLAGALLAALVWWVALALGWSALVAEGDPRPAAASWCRTQVARYVPGGFWQLIARATTVTGGVRDKLTAVTAENVIVLLVSLAIGGAWAGVHDWRFIPLALLIAAPLLASRWLERRTKITRRRVRRTSATYAVGYLAYGVMGVLVQVAVSGVRSPTYPLYVAGATCVAWAVGLVVVFAPGGVGVRELVYIAMLSGLYPPSELEAAAVTSRLVTVVAELLVLAYITRPQLLRRRSRVPAADPGAADPASSSGSGTTPLTDETSPRRAPARLKSPTKG